MRLVLAIHQRKPGTAHTRIGFVFDPDWWDGEPVNREPAKCSGLVWADPEWLPPDVVEYTTAVLRAGWRDDPHGAGRAYRRQHADPGPDPGQDRGLERSATWRIRSGHSPLSAANSLSLSPGHRGRVKAARRCC